MIFRWGFIGKGRFCLYLWAQVYCLSGRATVRADLLAMDAALQAQTLSRAWLHRGRRLRIHRLVTCVFTGRTNCVFTQVITCIVTGCHLHIYRARRLRRNTRPPAIAATAPSPSARFAPVRGNCSPAMGSRVPSGTGGALGLPGCPGVGVGCTGADDAVGPAVGCGEVVG